MLATLAFAALAGAPTSAPEVPAPPRDGAPTIAILPLVIEGTLPEVWRTKADDRLHDALSRSSIVVTRVESSPCTATECAVAAARSVGADYGVWARLTVQPNQRDYAFEIVAVGADTQNVVASVPGKCELCGFEEVVAMVEAKAAALPPTIERFGGNPVVSFSSTPEGVEVSIDGEVVGVTPLELPLTAGKHRARGSKPGYLPQTLVVEAVEGVRKELSFSLAVAPVPTPAPKPAPAPDPKQTRGLVIAGAVLTSVGIAGVGTGATLLTLAGRPYKSKCEPDAQGDCRLLFDTVAVGAIPTALGSAALGAGVALLIVATSKKRRERSAAARVRPTGDGLAIAF